MKEEEVKRLYFKVQLTNHEGTPLKGFSGMIDTGVGILDSVLDEWQGTSDSILLTPVYLTDKEYEELPEFEGW